jgi:hypothetical protein
MFRRTAASALEGLSAVSSSLILANLVFIFANFVFVLAISAFMTACSARRAIISAITKANSSSRLPAPLWALISLYGFVALAASAAAAAAAGVAFREPLIRTAVACEENAESVAAEMSKARCSACERTASWEQTTKPPKENKPVGGEEVAACWKRTWNGEGGIQ